MWVAIWWQWVCGCSDFLSQIGFKFWFYFEFLLWVSEFDHGFVYVFACLDAKKMK